MADDRDALIATLTAEGWEERWDGQDYVDIAMRRVAECRVWRHGDVDLYGLGNQWSGTFEEDTPNSVILAAARAAVEAEQ